MSLWPSLEWKTFTNDIKVNIYAYANKIIKITKIFELTKP